MFPVDHKLWSTTAPAISLSSRGKKKKHNKIKPTQQVNKKQHDRHNNQQNETR